jgi:tetratricopeptide (TPR) repeat protein
VAAGVYGKEAFEEGLRQAIRRDVSVRYCEAMAGREPGDQPDQQEEATASSHLVASSSTFIGPLPEKYYVQADIRRMIGGDVARLWDAPTSEEDTHPSPVERIKLLERLRRGESAGQEKESCEIAAESWQTVADLFGEPGRWQADQNQRQATAAKDQAEAKRHYFDNVIAQIDAYLAENPGLSVPVRDRAGVRLKMHDYAGAVVDFTEAIREFTRAIELEPDRLSILLRRADAYASQGDFNAALEDYGTVLQRDPLCAEALAERSRVLRAQGESELAEADFRAALAIEPSL